MADLVTVPELAAFLKIPNLDAGNAAPVIAGVSESVRAYTRRAWATVDDEVIRMNGNGSSSLLLPRLPVRAITSIVEDPDGEAIELVDGEHFEWDADGLVRRIDGDVFRRRLRWYEFTYSHGLEDEEPVPADVKLVVLRVCARGAVNPEGLEQETLVGYSAVFGSDWHRLCVLGPADERALWPYRP